MLNLSFKAFYPKSSQGPYPKGRVERVELGSQYFIPLSLSSMSTEGLHYLMPLTNWFGSHGLKVIKYVKID